MLAILYFGLMQLLMMDASRELNEARRFRARIVALTYAENGAELAARDMINQHTANVSQEDAQGKYSGELNRAFASPNATEIPFTIVGRSETTGLAKTKATVYVQGRILGSEVRIQYTMHSQ